MFSFLLMLNINWKYQKYYLSSLACPFLVSMLSYILYLITLPQPS